MPKTPKLEETFDAIQEEKFEKRNQTTKEHFELFKKESKKWIKEFGLIGWDIKYEHDGEKERNYLGWCQTNCTNRSATIALCKDWKEDKVTEYEIKKTAFHESCELLMARIDVIARCRIIGPDEIEEERHHLIRVFENLLWQPTQG